MYLNVIDLFAGAGGLSEGFLRQRFNILAKIEKDKAACETLLTRMAYYNLKENNKLHIYKDYIQGEISKELLLSHCENLVPSKIINQEINKENLLDIFAKVNKLLMNKELDGIIGGPPCQAYSIVGRSRNSYKKDNDERIYLYQYYAQFLDYFKPKFFLFENVKGLLSFKDHNNELLLPKILEEFSKVGYQTEVMTVNAADYGVPQKRERVFIFGYNNMYNFSNFFETLEAEKNSSTITINRLFQDLPKIKSGETSFKYNRGIEKDSYLNETGIRDEWDILTQHIARRNNERDLEIYKMVASGKRNGKNITYEMIPEHLQTHNNTSSFLDRFKALDGEGVAHTIVAHIAKDGHHYIHPDDKQNRSITVREAARIQTFPDNFYFESSRTTAFQQIGNAVPPLLAEKLAKVVKDIVILQKDSTLN
ncbi:DNA (cytosine-5-)-methyltransferase [Bacillus cereus]|nr:DNA (cytosine-5-)-methyltransferase [Bacillus cereus]PFK47632.1 DNA (cytosine-5-)-methyltransferase [Bacillus cereus]PFL52731.1 DNA (cytosine-5-)-methyltransferase [Bacillus cereus]PFQ50340.1 DNA (cytosine-5-)-methyltransferase [Bacillus cereus]PFS30574.1 DNA (cytosine-5-)-methyltransferase [Bacillus cereus]